MSGTIPAGAVNDSLVSHYDILPTILEMTGVDNPETELLPGRSFAARLRGASGGHEAVVACDEYGSENLVCSSIRKTDAPQSSASVLVVLATVLAWRLGVPRQPQ